MKNLCVLLLLLTGCVSSQRIVTGPTRPAIAPAAVRIYRAMPADAQEIGIVTAEADGKSQSAMNRALQEISKQAAALGANGFTVIGSGTKSQTDGGFGTVVPVGGGAGLIMIDSTTSHKTVVKARAFYIGPGPTAAVVEKGGGQ